MEVHVSLVGRKDLTGEIYRQLRRAILDGRLPPGGRLPPTRELARRLNVSRTTVTVAYDRLTGEGFITSRVGPGPSSATASPARPAEFALPPPGSPDGRTLFSVSEPARRLRLARQLRPAAVGTGAYGDPAGYSGLRQAIARHIGLARGVQASAEQVVVTNGTQQAVDVVARVLLAPGDRVAVESPGYGPPRRLMASLGAEVVGVTTAASFGRTSSTDAATRHWAASGPTSTSPPSAARRSGRTRRWATRRRRPTSGTGATTSTTSPPKQRRPSRGPGASPERIDRLAV